MELNNKNAKALFSYMRLPYMVNIETAEEDGDVYYVARHPELPGCLADGNTREEAENNLVSARADYIAALLERGLPVPTPLQSNWANVVCVRWETDASGRGKSLPLGINNSRSVVTV